MPLLKKYDSREIYVCNDVLVATAEHVTSIMCSPDGVRERSLFHIHIII